ncbi:hypothetical protein L258_00054 [Brucella abortus 84-0928]|nr:hypothetical protein L258_00054 [Brucella abortus 84-0928]
MFWLRMAAATIFFTALLPYCPTALLPYCPTQVTTDGSVRPLRFFTSAICSAAVDQWGQRCLRVEIMFCRIGFIAFDIDADGRA